MVVSIKKLNNGKSLCVIKYRTPGLREVRCIDGISMEEYDDQIAQFIFDRIVFVDHWSIRFIIDGVLVDFKINVNGFFVPREDRDFLFEEMII